MNAMKMALQKKMMEMKGGSKYQGAEMEHLGPTDHDKMEDEAKSGHDIAGPAPSLKGDDMHEGHVDPEDHLDGASADHEGKEMSLIHGLEKLHKTSPGDAIHGESDGDAMHTNIIKAIADRGHGGGGANSLQARAADKAKEKFAAINKHKAGKV